uniref:Highly reducing polyketide synthase ALT1 n=1 Tax=Alternaria alternata TaxID=5599 RepID=ALT1_ALTAL|nr:RecName: Full=Highly reducing polyketide synthase ALT1; Short=HR-PKS FUM1; AltName: Full=AAL-toxin biosynthesis cluster protein 1 [Alternaria alternata]BBG74267.1 polyketide synthase [Alternaria alternata]
MAIVTAFEDEPINGNGMLNAPSISPDPVLPLAIVGMGMRLPGAIHTPEHLWQTLVNKRSTRCEIPDTRFSTNGFHSPSAKPGSIAMRHGHFLADSDSLHHLDPSFFSMGMNEAVDIDPQQRLLLEVVYECMESSGQVNWQGSKIGCWVGVWGEDWLDLHAKDTFDSGMFRIAGGHDFAISNRISYEYNLKGPSYTIKAGCSSSLIALHEAVRALRAGDCDGAIVAGTNLIFSPTMSIGMTEQGVLSPDASCKSFDANANGYARGEAINAIYLKRLDVALQNGDSVRAVVRGTSSNSDGKTPGMSMPSSESHISLIRQAYREAGLDPAQTPFVEAHGTGTPVGDPLEAIAIARVFGGRDRTLYLGSVKPNLGHSEGASGISSILKAIQAMEHRTIPPNLNFNVPNPKIPFAESNMVVPCASVPWPEGQPVRVSVNSFGIGGSNAHCILESVEEYLGAHGAPWMPIGTRLSNTYTSCFPRLNFNKTDGGISTTSLSARSVNGMTNLIVHSTDEEMMQSPAVQARESYSNHHTLTETTNPSNNTATNGVVGYQPRKLLYVVSAGNATSLTAKIMDLHRYHQDHQAQAVDVAYTLCNRRDHLTHRTYAIASAQPSEGCLSDPALEFSPPAKINTTTPSHAVMVFTGQGAQWAGMASELVSDYPVFRATVSRLSRVLSQLEHAPAWNLLEELRKPEATSRIGEAEFSQPLVCAVQVGLVDLLRHWGLSAAAVIGHSSGEIGAAYAADAITADEAITIAYYRGYVNKSHTRQGGMAAIGLGVSQVAPFLSEGVTIACDNSPQSATISGDKDVLRDVCSMIRRKQPDCLVRELKVPAAYHSHHMLDLGGTLESLLKGKVHSQAPAIPFFSSVKVKEIREPGSLDAAYWRENLESPVQFTGALKILLAAQPSLSRTVFVEIGPHSALAGPLRQIFKAHGTGQEGYTPAMIRGKDCVDSVLSLVGDLFLQGITLDLSRISPPANVITDLPLYPWNHEKEFWSESRVGRDWRFRKYPNHELLGSQTLESSKLQPQWRNMLKLEHVPWLRDHQVMNDTIFPCAGYLAMAVEAVRQATEAADVEGFSLRNVVVRAALVVTESKPVELLTALQPVRLTNTLDSVWWEFSIMSHNGSVWQKHCNGQVRPGRDAHHIKAAFSEQAVVSRDKQYPRPVDSLYSELYRLGLRYGPAFCGLNKVHCQPGGKQASAILMETIVSESSYAIHPTTIDHCLQLLFPASCEGIFYRAEKLCVPTGIDNLYLADGKTRESEGARIEASSVARSGGAIFGAAKAFSKIDDALLLSLEGGKFSPIEVDDGIVEDLDPLASAHLVWKPHLDFADMHDLIRPNQDLINDRHNIDLVERLTLVAMMFIQERMGSVSSPANLDHIARFRNWIDAQVAGLKNGTYSGLEKDVEELLSLKPNDRLPLLKELEQIIIQSAPASTAVLICRIIDRCDDILQGRIDGIEVLQADNGLTNFYNYIESRTESVDFLTAAGHTQPTLRILEIGAGTGGASQVVLDSLTNQAEHSRLYSTYAYTDVSAGFFVAARERFKKYPALDFRVLDISKDPLEQGFHASSFDLIIANNVLHATPFLSQTLANVRKLLAPEGYLFLQELSPKMRMVNLIMGILPGWWLGAAEGRSEEPYLSPEQWDSLLRQTGFSSVDVVYDAPSPYQVNANIIARAASEPQARDEKSNGALGAPKAVLLHAPGDEVSERAAQIRSSLEESGLDTSLISIEQFQANATDTQGIIVSLLDLTTPFFASMSASKLTAIQSLVANLGSAHMMWILPRAQKDVSCSDDPAYGMSLGLIRTLRSERSVAITTVEVDTFDNAAFSAVARLAIKLAHQQQGDRTSISSGSDLDPDREFVLTKGVLETGRFHPVSLTHEMAAHAPASEATTLRIGRAGLLQTLKWVDLAIKEPEHNEVVVEPRCVGLNFRDVLVCMGIVEANDVSIGLEGSGVVRKVGNGVTGLQAGDRVFYMADNCFSSQITISALRCVKIPSSLSFEQAATMPCVYATVIHSLLDMGGLQSGQSVLIHSACGGIGIAALNLCRAMPGVEVYVTVGSEEKVQYLMQEFGLAREQIFHSRDTSFVEDVRAATGGRGVDVVLNSLSGELLHASWECVAPYGKMLEIGKRDFIGKAQLAMDLFEANRSFIGIDLARFDAARCGRLLQRTIDMYVAGAIQPVAPIKVFGATEAEASFRYMQKGTHLGKIVVSIGKAAAAAATTRQAVPTQLNPVATYVLVGGLGGLGRAVATWMVERGARHLLFLSRSAGQQAAHQAFFTELQCQGCSAQAVQGDVTLLGDVERALAAAPAGKPVRGILQMAMVLRDKAFADMDLADWHDTVTAKVLGTWNLHRAAPADMDFFLATGSISGLFGLPGQANYAAANSYLTALVQHRRAHGMPASVVHIGMIEDVGYLAENPARADALRAAGGFFLRTRQLLQAIDWALAPPSHKPHHLDHELAIGLRTTKPLLDPGNRVVWRSDPRMGLYHNLTATVATTADDGSDDSDALRFFITSITAEPALLDDPASLDLVTRTIGTRIYTFMLHPLDDIDSTASLTALGVDSLVTIELRNWIKRNFAGLDFSTLEILDARTIAGLAKLILDALKARFGSSTADQQRLQSDYLNMKAP